MFSLICKDKISKKHSRKLNFISHLTITVNYKNLLLKCILSTILNKILKTLMMLEESKKTIQKKQNLILIRLQGKRKQCPYLIDISY